MTHKKKFQIDTLKKYNDLDSNTIDVGQVLNLQ